MRHALARARTFVIAGKVWHKPQGIIRPMAIVFDKPSLWQRVWPLLRGFDLLLLVAVLVLAGMGLTAMYSSGFDHGTRFADHGRNMLIAAGIMFVVAQVPP